MVIDSIDKTAKEQGLFHPFKYMNYATAGQDPIASYGSESNALLDRVAQHYDPQGFFQQNLVGGFKLRGST